MSVVCRICLEVTTKESHGQYYSLNDESDSRAMKIKSKLKDCFPQFMVDVIKDSVICNNCINALYVVYKFRKKIMETEEKISKYMEEENAKSDKSIDINLVLAWLPKYEAYKNGKKTPLSETVVTSNIYDCCLKLFDSRLESDTNIKSEPIDETDIANNSAFGELLLEIDWNAKNVPKSPENLNCSPTSQVCKSEEGVLPEFVELHNPDMYTSSDQFDLKKESVDLSDNYDVKDVLIGIEEVKDQPSAIVSGVTYDYNYFDEFEKQFAGYTMDELYSNQLIAMPECSVVVDRLTDEEIKCWTAEKVQQKTWKSHYRCYSCNYYTSLMEKFVQHMNNRVHKKKKYLSRKKPHIAEGKQKYHKCALCNFRTKLKRNFSSHMLTHERSLIDGTKCYMCDYVLSNMEDRRKHLKSCHSKTLIKCTLCSFSTDNHILFKDHVKHHMSNYKCIECSYATIYKKSVIKHYLCRHFRVAPFICIKCNINFSSRFKLVQHVLNYKNIHGVYAEHNYAINCRRSGTYTK